jgi:hypothetical protein
MDGFGVFISTIDLRFASGLSRCETEMWLLRKWDLKWLGIRWRPGTKYFEHASYGMRLVFTPGVIMNSRVGLTIENTRPNAQRRALHHFPRLSRQMLHHQDIEQGSVQVWEVIRFKLNSPGASRAMHRASSRLQFFKKVLGLISDVKSATTKWIIGPVNSHGFAPGLISYR